MQFRTCRRVLQVRLFLRENVVACPECRQSAFVKARENQFFLPRVNVAVTDGKDTGNGGFELFRIHGNLFAVKFQPLIGHRAEFGL